MSTTNIPDLPFTFARMQGARRREAAQLHDKVVELRRAGWSVYRAGERQVKITMADRTRLLSHGELLRLVISGSDA